MRTPFTVYPLEQCDIAAWSGGKTTTLRLMPQTAGYAARDFVYRISTATVEVPSSVFTSLPDYERVLLLLEGEMQISHTVPHRTTALRPYMPYRFDGAWHTEAKGCVRDFNLMLKKGAAEGTVTPLVLQGASCVELSAAVHARYPLADRVLFLAAGQVTVCVGEEIACCRAGDIVVMENTLWEEVGAVTLTHEEGTAAVMVCDIFYDAK